MVTFSASKTALLEVFKKLKAGYKHRRKQAMMLYCEVTITDNKAAFTIPGVTIYLTCETQGVAKFTIPMLYFEDLIKSYKGGPVKFIIHRQGITIGLTTVEADITYIEDDTILKSINLPLNFTDYDIINLLNAGYTEEELAFNKLQTSISDALKRLNQNIKTAYKAVEHYKIPFETFKSSVIDLIVPANKK